MNDFDPIVDEVRRAPVAHATMFNYDLDAIFRDTNRGSERNYLTERSLQASISVRRRTVSRTVP